jgi:phosphatidylglycerophosphate synthase
MILASCVAVATGWRTLLPLAALASFAFILRYRRPSRSSLPGGVGWADALTGVRLALLSLVAASMPEAPAAWTLAALAANVVLDALDGFVARKLGDSTAFGAVFDREVDAFFVLVAYLHFRLDGWIGAAVLFAGLLPYAYRLFAAVGPVPVAAGHKERAAAAMAGLNFLLLLAAMAAPDYSSRILIASVAVVCASFAGSFMGLYRHAHPLP